MTINMVPAADTNADNEESGWKMVSGDVFRAPTNSLALCVQTGSGVQIITSGFITLFFAALGDSSRSGNMGCPSLLSQVPGTH